MTNPTSNYNFQMPTATDLVTDLPADFEVFGQAVDTRLKALQPGTTLGDLAYSSATANTNTRLGIGTSGQVLAVSGGGVPAWTTASAGALAKISTTTFTNVATQDIDSVFTSTYDAYLIVITNAFSPSGNTNDLHLQMRYSTNTETADYFGAIQTIVSTPTTNTTGANPAAHCLLSNGLGNSTVPTTAVFNIVLPLGGGNSGRANLYGNSFSAVAPEVGFFGYEASTARTYTGFRLKASTGNVSGTVVVYGLGK